MASTLFNVNVVAVRAQNAVLPLRVSCPSKLLLNHIDSYKRNKGRQMATPHDQDRTATSYKRRPTAKTQLPRLTFASSFRRTLVIRSMNQPERIWKGVLVLTSEASEFTQTTAPPRRQPRLALTLSQRVATSTSAPANIRLPHRKGNVSLHTN